jgi:hypothetical protein
VGPRTGLNDTEVAPSIEHRPHDCPARSQSLPTRLSNKIIKIPYAGAAGAATATVAAAGAATTTTTTTTTTATATLWALQSMMNLGPFKVS